MQSNFHSLLQCLLQQFRVALGLWSRLVFFRNFCTILNDLQALVSNISHCSTVSSDEVLFFHIAKLACVIPGPLRKTISFANVMANGPLRRCVLRPAVKERWTSIALDVSSYITMRIVVFCSAVLVMGHYGTETKLNLRLSRFD